MRKSGKKEKAPLTHTHSLYVVPCRYTLLHTEAPEHSIELPPEARKEGRQPPPYKVEQNKNGKMEKAKRAPREGEKEGKDPPPLEEEEVLKLVSIMRTIKMHPAVRAVGPKAPQSIKLCRRAGVTHTCTGKEISTWPGAVGWDRA